MRNIRMREVERIKNYILDETTSNVDMTIEFSSSSPSDSLDKVSSVLTVVLVGLSQEEWPEDTWWRNHLPRWFVESFDHELEKILNDESLWDFGSWVDANKFRGWEWMSCAVADELLTINLKILDHPYVIEPFEYVIRASGGKDIKIIEH